MKAGRWTAVQSICHCARLTISARAADVTIFQINEWLARKRLGGDAKLCEEISAFDDSALAPRFALAKYALLDDVENAKRAADQGVSSGNVSIDDLLDWPLLDEFRAEPDFQPWLAQRRGKPRRLHAKLRRVSTAETAATTGDSVVEASVAAQVGDGPTTPPSDTSCVEPRDDKQDEVAAASHERVAEGRS